MQEENQESLLPGNNTESEYKRRRITRSNENKIVFGLCGGLGRGTSVSAQTYRLIFLIATYLGGWGIIAYLIASALVPRDKSESILTPQKETKLKTANRKLLFGYLLISLGVYFLFDFVNIFYVFRLFGIPENVFLPGVVLLIGVFFTIKSFRFVSPVMSPPLRMRRSKRDYKIAGVCGGLAEYINVGSLPVRVLCLLILFSTLGVGIVLYLLFIVLIPKTGEDIEQR